jgi:glutamyl-tRNA synthetase
LPEALANFIALIGWSPGGDVEIMSMSEMIEAFSLEGLQPSPGVFDLDKLRWMNGVAIRNLPQGKLADVAINYARDPSTYEYWSRHETEPHVQHALNALREAAEHHHGYVVQALALVQERAQTLAELATAGEFFFVDDPTMEPAAVAKWFTLPHLEDLFHYLLDEIAKASPDGKTPIEVSRCETIIRSYAATKQWDKLGPVVHPVRVALTGKTAGPGLFELMSVLGPERMTRRIQRALDTVRQRPPKGEAEALE